MFLRFFALIAFSTFAIYWFHIRLKPEDATRYRQLVQESTQLRTKHALADKPACQKRKNVEKEIWSQQQSQHFQIQSDESDLTLSQKGKTEAVEQLKNIRCQVQDDFTLTADQGIYSFPSHQFTAQNNCHLVQNQNFIDGTQIHLDLAEETITYDNPKGHFASGPLNFTADQLVWYKKEDRIHLTQHVVIEQPNQFTLLANEGTLTLDELRPIRLVLEGNVRLISSRIQDKESYAVADTLIYTPQDQSLLFCSSKKVLFWQEGLSLSASEVLIRKDQSIEGKGNVHFAFDLEEQSVIDTFFKQYL